MSKGNKHAVALRLIGVALLLGSLVASAYFMALALDLANNRWVGWVTLLPLFLSIRLFSPCWALCAGTLWGSSLCIFSASVGLATVDPSLGSVVLLALIPGGYACLGSLMTRRIGFSPLLLGLGWLAVELVLQPVLLHRGLLASTQGDGLVIRTLGNLAGSLLVAFLVAYVNATLLTILDDACVIACASTRAISRSSSVPIRWLRKESPVCVVDYALSSQPRAPPR